MKKLSILLFILIFVATGFSQQKFSVHKAGEFAFPKTGKKGGHPNAALSSQFSDTLNNYFDDFFGPANLAMYSLDAAPPNDSGYIAGTNLFGITETLERFNLPVGGTLNSVLFGFGKAVGTGSFSVTVRADNAGTPGSILQTFTVAINQTDSVAHYFNHFIPVMQVSWNCAANLPSPITFNAGASFWAGLRASNNAGDTIGLLSTETGGQTNPSHINDVDMQYMGSFATYNAAFSSEFLFCIFPVIGYPSCAISGNVYNDVNSNNVKDAGDTGIANIKITAGNFIGFTDLSGNYTVYADSGNYSVTANVQYATETPASINVSVPNSGSSSSGNDFAAHYIPGIRDVSVKVVASPFRPGLGGAYSIYVQNNGTQTDSGSVNITLDDSLQYYWSVPDTISTSGNILTFNYPPIAPGQNTMIYLSTYVPVDVGISYPLASSASVTPIVNDFNTLNNYDTSHVITSGSYDPNEKSVSPQGDISPSFVSGGNYLYYTIQFQNTGTDTAFNIHVTDTLSAMLNVASLEVLSSSHAYTTSVKNNYVVTFSFNNILLLDSGRSQPKSHGYIYFRIKPKTNLPLGSTIKNTGYIYFDFNSAVVTNSTTTSVLNPTTFVELTGNNKSTTQVFPNPFSEEINLVFNESANYRVRITDLLGRIKYNGDIKSANYSKLDLSSLLAGCYIITVEGPKGIHQLKVIKQ